MRNRPALLTVATFLGLIVIGTVALALVSFGAGQRDDFITAPFTAVSAVCVTGLGVVDLSRESIPAQVLVLVLLQLGGLGVLTLSNWILLTLRRRMHLHGSVMTHDAFGGVPRVSPRQVLQGVIAFTLLAEGLGATLLSLRFAADYPWGEALWLGTFHAVSAFCNAGFSLFSDSLCAYRGDLVVNVVVTGLIVTGGIGFIVAVDLVEWLGGRWRGTRRYLSYHSQVVLWTTATLLLIGFLGFLVFEWSNTLQAHSKSQGALEAFFLSVTARTAGFNTVDTAHLTNLSLIHLILLMMVGASPGSTGGGIKTTSFAILWARVRCHLLNRQETEMLGRRVSREYVAKAMAVALLYCLMAMLAVMALQATEFGELPHDQTRGTFLEHLFEVISALSTVGLSTGTTGELSDAGLGVLMVCMFVGRLGPLVLAVSLIGERPRLPYLQPKGDVMVG